MGKDKDEHAVSDRIKIEVDRIWEAADKTPPGIHFTIHVKERGIAPYAEKRLLHTFDKCASQSCLRFQISSRLVKVGRKEGMIFDIGLRA